MFSRPLATFCAASALLLGCENDEFAEGFRSDPEFRRETFAQVDPAPVDVLWVVDTSCSMSDEQQLLADHFSAFIDFFRTSGLRFRIGVTDTDVEEEDTLDGLDGRLSGDPSVLTPDTPSLEDAFVDAALMGITDRHDDERGLHAAWTALGPLEEPGRPNNGFLREDANLAVIIVSDEPDYSTLGEADSGNFTDWQGFSTFLDALKGDPARTALSGIVGIGEGGFDDPVGCNLPDEPTDPHNWGQGAQRGSGYLEAIRQTGGYATSICSEDWVELLARLGLLVAGLHETFPLTDVPVPETLDVQVEGVLGAAWEYDAAANAVRFTDSQAIPRPGAEVEVTYRVLDAP